MVFKKLQNFWVAKAPRNELLYSLTFSYLHNYGLLRTNPDSSRVEDYKNKIILGGLI